MWRAFVAALALAAAIPAAEAESRGGHDGVLLLSPEEWARQALKQCLEEERLWQGSLVALERNLAGEAQSREQLEFPDKESHAHRKWLEAQRQAYFDRLKFLLRGENARFLESSAERFRDSARASGSYREDAFRKTLGLLFEEATPCGLAALESTLTYAIFDLPFSETKLEEGLSSERLFISLDQAFHHQVESTGSVEGAYLTLRPTDANQAFRYVSELVARLTGIASAYVARARNDQKAAFVTQEQLEADRAKALEDPRDNPLPKRFGKGDEELWVLVAQLQQFFRLAAEPFRIQNYLHSKVEELEGALRTNIPDKTAEKLFERGEKELFGNAGAIRRLAAMAPQEVVVSLKPILNRWFQRDAIPAVQKALYEDPFSAYWFYVQTGMTARRPDAYKGSRVLLGASAFDLEILKDMELGEAVERLRAERIPDDFVDHHAALEEALTRATMSREEVLHQITQSEFDDRVKKRLRGYAEDRRESETVSTTDVYSWVVRDASKFRGSVNWDLVHAAIEILHTSKRETLQEQVQAALDSHRTEDTGRLARYLQTSGQLMLELEQKQTNDDRFQEKSGGSVVGWILKRFLVSGGVPVQLWAPGGVTGEEFAELLNELTQKNELSGNDYQGKGASDLHLVHDGQEYHENLLEVINGACDFINISQFSWTVDYGGKEIAYRLMGKKLGLEGAMYERFLDYFQSPHKRILLKPNQDTTVRLYDVPTSQMKYLLFYYFFKTTENPAVAFVRKQIESALGGELTCNSVAKCGDLSTLLERTGTKHRSDRLTEPSYEEVWQAYRQLQGLFENQVPELREVEPRASLAEYVADSSRLRRFIRRHGRRKDDDPSQPFEINIFLDGKNNFINKKLKKSQAFPYFYQDALRDLFYPLMEFDVRVLLWKGPVFEFPWHIGPIPWPGRKFFGVFPMPFIPYPWLGGIFTGMGPKTALFLQWLLVSDPRNWWAMDNHTKNISSETVAIESGMGFASKYFNIYQGFKTWHDVGIKVSGPVVGDVNDAYVQMFNEARVNNSGIPGARGVKVPKLAYEDYRYRGEEVETNRSWVITTNPEMHDYNYRGAFMAALAAARKNIYIDNFYLSDPLVARMLIRKAREFRGRVSCAGRSDFQCSEAKREAVEIHVVFPDSSDQPNADLLGTAHRHEMLHLGVKIYRWNPPQGWSAEKMLHTKVWMVDYEEGQPALTYIGTANLSQRSHLADNELGILSTSPALAKEVYERLFDPDMTEDSQAESPENFHIVWSTNPAVRAVRWLQFFLVDLTWMF